MILEIKKNKNKKGNRGHTKRLINYISGNTKDHSSALDSELTLITTHDFDLVDPTDFGSINLRNADFSHYINKFNERIALNEAVDDPMKHFIISLAPGEKLNNGQWFEIVNDFMSEMGYEKCLYIATQHNDTEKEHVHITACTIKDEYKNPVVNQWQDKKRGMIIMRNLEVKYGLVRVDSPADGLDINNSKQQPSKSAIRHIIDVAITEHPSQTLPQLITRLNSHGVGVSTQFKEGIATGLSYSFNGLSSAGSKLGGAGRYALPGLLKKGISYDYERDHHELERLTQKEENRREGSQPRTKAPQATEFNKELKAKTDGKKNNGLDISFYLVVHINKDRIKNIKSLYNKPKFTRYNKQSAELYFPCVSHGSIDKIVTDAILAFISFILSFLFGDIYLTLASPDINLPNNHLKDSPILNINKQYKKTIENYFRIVEKDLNNDRSINIIKNQSTQGLQP